MSEKRFRVSVDKGNGVGLFNAGYRLMYIQFKNIEDAISCKNALMHQCNLMNEQQATINKQEKIINELKNLIYSSNTGMEETLDGYEYVYSITETELKDCLKELGIDE